MATAAESTQVVSAVGLEVKGGPTRLRSSDEIRCFLPARKRRCGEFLRCPRVLSGSGAPKAPAEVSAELTPTDVTVRQGPAASAWVFWGRFHFPLESKRRRRPDEGSFWSSGQGCRQRGLALALRWQTRASGRRVFGPDCGQASWKNPAAFSVREPSPAPRGVGVCPLAGHGAEDFGPLHPAPQLLARQKIK